VGWHSIGPNIRDGDSSSQMSEIESIHNAEEDNYRIALTLPGDTSSLHEDFIEL